LARTLRLRRPQPPGDAFGAGRPCGTSVGPVAGRRSPGMRRIPARRGPRGRRRSTMMKRCGATMALRRSGRSTEESTHRASCCSVSPRGSMAEWFRASALSTWCYIRRSETGMGAGSAATLGPRRSVAISWRERTSISIAHPRRRPHRSFTPRVIGKRCASE
jgi:hypothetical protein